MSPSRWSSAKTFHTPPRRTARSPWSSRRTATGYVLERPIVEESGTRWSYCGGASALLGSLIARGTGDTLPGFAERTMFGPLGIDSHEWMAGPDGVASAVSGLRLAPRDLARIGRTVLAGVWEGRRVVPAGWLDQALRPRVPIDGERHHGYHWHLGATGSARWAAAMGNGGQRLHVVPGLDLVIAVTAGNDDTADQAGTLVDDPHPGRHRRQLGGTESER